MTGRGARGRGRPTGAGRYDEAYFEKWYRAPRSRVHTPAEVARKVRMVVGVAEHLLARPLRSVLDVGCGEGAWQPILRRMRPGVRYTGVDPSEYAVRRFGRRRNIRLGSFDRLDEQNFDERFDLVVCCDVLNYLSEPELVRGLRHVRDLLGGMAYLELYAAGDDVVGDVRAWRRRPAPHYRRLFRRSGLTSCGMHCYVGDALERDTVALERAWDGAGAP